MGADFMSALHKSERSTMNTQNTPNAVSFIKCDKFKTSAVSFDFVFPLDRKTATLNSIIPYILKQGCRKYNTSLELNRYFDSLYGADYSCDSKKSGKNQIINFTFSCVSDTYSNGFNPFDKLLDLAFDMIFDPFTANGTFYRDYVEREKENLKIFLDGIKNDKREYAKKRLIEEMFENDIYSIFPYGYTEDLMSFDENILYKYYKDVFVNSLCGITVAGAFDEESVRKKIDSRLKSVNIKNLKLEFPAAKAHTDMVKTIKEPTDVTQSKLEIGFTTPILRNDTLYYAFMVFNDLFGGSPHSKLFLNVREKLSLAYYAASGYNSYKGFMMVSSGIEKKNYEKAKNEILNQLEEMKKGNFTEEDVECSKLSLTNRYKSVNDSLPVLLGISSAQKLYGIDTNIAETVRQINLVTGDEIISAANSVCTDTVYLLESID